MKDKLIEDIARQGCHLCEMHYVEDDKGYCNVYGQELCSLTIENAEKILEIIKKRLRL